MSETSMFLLPPAKHLCQTCGRDHPAHYPHDRTSLYYQMSFHMQNGRYPTWNDAWAHCEPQLIADWKRVLLEQHPDQAKHITEEQPTGENP